MGKRWLYLAHRWLGITLCIFMALWFLSGVVMMYVGYPKLTQTERLQASQPITPEHCCASRDSLLSSLPPGTSVRSLRLAMVGGEALLLASAGNKGIVAVDARSGHPIPPTNPDTARKAISAFAPTAAVGDIEVIQEDAWTHSKALDLHRPLYRATIKDDELAVLYVSGVTGEVIRDVSVVEKYWNWIGAWLHWLYPFRGGFLDPLWADIVIYSSLAASLLALAGMAIGLMRWRAQGYPNGSRSPYRNAMMRWHHVIGLFFGLLVFLWIVSGLLSVNPWKVFDSGARRPLENSLDQALLARDFDAAAAINCFNRDGFDIRELEWTRFQGRIHAVARNSDNETKILSSSSPCRLATTYTEDEVRNEALRLMPHARLIDSVLQDQFDWHYNARAPHTMTGGFEKPLPVLVAKFDDPHATWLYMDINTARVVQRIDDYARVKRWLFSFFHSWDWKLLLDNRPIWDVLLIIGSIAGFFVSVTGMALGWKRLMK